jgi:propionyl-CoA carboxylase alpha chain
LLNVSTIGADGAVLRSVAVSSKWSAGDPVWQGQIGGKTVSVQVRPILNGATLAYRGIQTPVYVYTEREAEMAALMPVKAAADMSKFLLCPMPGLVKAINTSEGQDVKAGDALAVVEAMKMENILRAERDGTVKKVNAKAGDSLAVDAIILEFA